MTEQLDKRYEVFSADWFHWLLRKAHNISDEVGWSESSDIHKIATRMAEFAKEPKPCQSN